MPLNDVSLLLGWLWGNADAFYEAANSADNEEINTEQPKLL